MPSRTAWDKSDFTPGSMEVCTLLIVLDIFDGCFSSSPESSSEKSSSLFCGLGIGFFFVLSTGAASFSVSLSGLPCDSGSLLLLYLEFFLFRFLLFSNESGSSRLDSGSSLCLFLILSRFDSQLVVPHKLLPTWHHTKDT